MNGTETIEGNLELVQNGGNAIEQMQRADCDIQIATAHKYPRDITKFRRRATEIACVDEETAASCVYRRPVGKDKDGKQTFAEGASIRLAEIVASTYGNLRVAAIVVSQTPRQVVCRGMCHDLENNVASSSEVIESTLKKEWDKDVRGKFEWVPMDERMRVVVVKAALAKARRDAIFQVVPRALCKSIIESSKEVAVGTVATLSVRRDKVIAWADSQGISRARLFSALKVTGIDGIGLSELEELTGLRTAIRDGDITLIEAFPEIENVKVEAPKVVTPNVEEKQEVQNTPKVEAPKVAKAKPVEEKPIEAKSEPAKKTAVQELVERMNSEGISASKVRDFAERINVKITSEDGARIVLERWEYVMNNCKA